MRAGMKMCDFQSALFAIRNAMVGKSSRQCPNCNSYSIISDNRTGGKVVMEYYHCEVCKSKWINQYDLTGQFMILMPENTV
jgi:hypothetical protein